jgi:uncharacterized membrane protein
MGPDALHFANLALAGTLLGKEVVTFLVVNPAVQTLPVPTQVAVQQALAIRFRKIGPWIFFSTLGTGIALSATVDSPGRGFAIAGSACVFAMLVVVFGGNVPINLWTDKQTAEVDPAVWAERRRRWNQFHALRVVLDAAAVACFILALLTVV